MLNALFPLGGLPFNEEAAKANLLEHVDTATLKRSGLGRSKSRSRRDLVQDIVKDPKIHLTEVQAKFGFPGHAGAATPLSITDFFATDWNTQLNDPNAVFRAAAQPTYLPPILAATPMTPALADYLSGPVPVFPATAAVQARANPNLYFNRANVPLSANPADRGHRRPLRRRASRPGVLGLPAPGGLPGFPGLPPPGFPGLPPPGFPPPRRGSMFGLPAPVVGPRPGGGQLFLPAPGEGGVPILLPPPGQEQIFVPEGPMSPEVREIAPGGLERVPPPLTFEAYQQMVQQQRQLEQQRRQLLAAALATSQQPTRFSDFPQLEFQQRQILAEAQQQSPARFSPRVYSPFFPVSPQARASAPSPPSVQELGNILPSPAIQRQDALAAAEGAAALASAAGVASPNLPLVLQQAQDAAVLAQEERRQQAIANLVQSGAIAAPEGREVAPGVFVSSWTGDPWLDPEFTGRPPPGRRMSAGEQAMLQQQRQQQQPALWDAEFEQKQYEEIVARLEQEAQEQLLPAPSGPLEQLSSGLGVPPYNRQFWEEQAQFLEREQQRLALEGLGFDPSVPLTQQLAAATGPPFQSGPFSSFSFGRSPVLTPAEFKEQLRADQAIAQAEADLPPGLPPGLPPPSLLELEAFRQQSDVRQLEAQAELSPAYSPLTSEEYADLAREFGGGGLQISPPRVYGSRGQFPEQFPEFALPASSRSSLAESVASYRGALGGIVQSPYSPVVGSPVYSPAFSPALSASGTNVYSGWSPQSGGGSLFGSRAPTAPGTRQMSPISPRSGGGSLFGSRAPTAPGTRQMSPVVAAELRRGSLSPAVQAERAANAAAIMVGGGVASEAANRFSPWGLAAMNLSPSGSSLSPIAPIALGDAFALQQLQQNAASAEQLRVQLNRASQLADEPLSVAQVQQFAELEQKVAQNRARTESMGAGLMDPNLASLINQGQASAFADLGDAVGAAAEPGSLTRAEALEDLADAASAASIQQEEASLQNAVQQGAAAAAEARNEGLFRRAVMSPFHATRAMHNVLDRWGL